MKIGSEKTDYRFKFLRYLVSVTLKLILSIVLLETLLCVTEYSLGIDAAKIILGIKASEPEVNALRKELGVDKPLLLRVNEKLLSKIHGDLGESYVYRRPVSILVGEALTNTIKLLVPAIFIGTILGMLIGFIVAYFRNAVLDSLLVLLVAIGFLPSLIVSTVCVYVVGYKLKIIFPDYWIAVSILSITSLFFTALTAYQSYKEILSSSFIRSLRAFGFDEISILTKYSYRSVFKQLFANLSNLIIYLLSSTVFVEIIFVHPGLGNLMVVATERLDFPVVMGISLIVIIVFFMIELISDIVQYAVNPNHT